MKVAKRVDYKCGHQKKKKKERKKREKEMVVMWRDGGITLHCGDNHFLICKYIKSIHVHF